MLCNCSELLEHMISQYELDYVSDEDGFQGDPIEFRSVLPTDKEYPLGKFLYHSGSDMLFFVGCKHESGFNLYLFGAYPLVRSVAVTLPNYVRNELIATITGEW